MEAQEKQNLTKNIHRDRIHKILYKDAEYINSGFLVFDASCVAVVLMPVWFRKNINNQ